MLVVARTAHVKTVAACPTAVSHAPAPAVRAPATRALQTYTLRPPLPLQLLSHALRPPWPELRPYALRRTRSGRTRSARSCSLSHSCSGHGRMCSGPRCHCGWFRMLSSRCGQRPPLPVRPLSYPLRLYALHPLSYLTRSGRRCRCGRSRIRSTVRAPAVRTPAVRTLAVRAPNPLRPCALRLLMPLLSLSLPLWPSGRMRSSSTRGRTNNNKGGDLHREG